MTIRSNHISLEIRNIIREAPLITTQDTMQYRYKRSLFLFRRDLRLDDNTGLRAALESSREVIPAFIFDPRQSGKANRFRGNHSLQFMKNSLEDLARQLVKRGAKLHSFDGLPHQVIGRLIQSAGIEAVFVNRDYTPFSIGRDVEIERVCSRRGIPFFHYDDYLLTTPEQVRKSDGTPYTVFSAFYRAASSHPLPVPRPNRHTNFATLDPDADSGVPSPFLSKSLSSKVVGSGGRAKALRILNHLERLSEYAGLRDYPDQQATSGLSAHLKFGTLSVRELYHAVSSQLDDNHPLIRQLYWRDFFTHIAFHFPHIFRGAFHRQYDGIEWLDSRPLFKRWCDGETGVPIVDAGMRQLKQTGEMHNRVRMISASFLVKDLHIDWRWGEKYFAQQLTDYDPAVNNGNWQWVASTGCDAAPYFRIFNPWLQQKKFDPDCGYIKRWIPQLRGLKPAAIHELNRPTTSPVTGYPHPVVDHSIAAKITSELYRSARQKKRGDE